MFFKMLMVIVIAFFLSGCATTNKKTASLEAEQLKNRVSTLEMDLQARDEEIMRLEDELERARIVREKRVIYKEEKVREGKTVESKKLSTKQIQVALKNAGFYKGALDGKIGPATTDAIKAFQRAKGLKPDGVVGRKTRIKLTGYLTGPGDDWMK